jgi:L-ascorbate metabolism protein UlaG (beta-lactamase superfamily)
VDNHQGFRYILRMTITYLNHNGFLLEAVNSTIIIDYVKGKLPELRDDKPVYVLCSNPQSDSFSEKVFRLAEAYKDVYYFLSYDISTKMVPEPLRKVTTFVHPGQEYKLARFFLNVHGSTETGVSFSIHVGYDTLFHAGSLNDWQREQNDEEKNKAMKRSYLKELASLEAHYKIVFLPCDPRLGSHMFDGPKAFLEHTTADHVFPMHFWDDYAVPEKAAQTLGDNVEVIRKKGQVFEI